MGAIDLNRNSNAKDIYINFLINMELFSSLDQSAIQEIVSLLDILEFQKNDPIFLEGEINNNVFFIFEGSVELTKFEDSTKQINRLALLKVGSYFGEFAVLTNAPKSASCYANEQSILLKLSGSNLLNILNRYPILVNTLIKKLSSTAYNFTLEHSYLTYFRPNLIKYNEAILNILPINLWKKLQLIPLSLEGNILSIAVTNPLINSDIEHIKTRNNKIQFDLYLIGQNEFELTSEKVAYMYQNKIQLPDTPEVETKRPSTFEIIKNSVLFSSVSETILKKIIPFFKQNEVSQGNFIYKAKDNPKLLYIVLDGEVEICKIDKNKNYNKISSLGPSDCFGMVEIFANKPYNTYAKVIKDSKIITIEKNLIPKIINIPQISIPVAKLLANYLQKGNLNKGLNYHDESNINLDRLRKCIPLSIMTSYKVLPIDIKEEEITIGLCNPNNTEIYQLLSRYTSQLRAKYVIIKEEYFNKNFDAFLNYFYPELNEKFSKKINKNFNSINVVDEILYEAIQGRASDIHFEPFNDTLTIRMRIDGVLQENDNSFSIKQGGKEIINRIKILSEMDITNHMTPQDGQLKTKIHGLNIFARASCVPTKFGEKIVLRIIRETGSILPLDTIAPDKRIVTLLKSIATYKQGLFIVTGPTGSGKSTSLYSLLNEINKVGVNIVTLEDPVELTIPGITQIEVNVEQKMTFAKGMKAILRQDPDCIMIGEIRDEESAKIVFEAAVTGHLVLSTLHTNSSYDILSRLKDFNIDYSTMSTGLIGVMAQRLVRKNCSSCLHEYIIEDEEKIFLESIIGSEKANFFQKFKKGSGCKNCNHSGFHGRLPVFEVWKKTHNTVIAIEGKASSTELLESLKEDGFNTILEFGIKMAISGLTTISEVKRCLYQGD